MGKLVVPLLAWLSRFLFLLPDPLRLRPKVYAFPLIVFGFYLQGLTFSFQAFGAHGQLAERVVCAQAEELTSQPVPHSRTPGEAGLPEWCDVLFGDLCSSRDHPVKRVYKVEVDATHLLDVVSKINQALGSREELEQGLSVQDGYEALGFGAQLADGALQIFVL